MEESNTPSLVRTRSSH